jgi:hypothetical protein
VSAASPRETTAVVKGLAEVKGHVFHAQSRYRSSDAGIMVGAELKGTKVHIHFPQQDNRQPGTAFLRRQDMTLRGSISLTWRDVSPNNQPALWTRHQQHTTATTTNNLANPLSLSVSYCILICKKFTYSGIAVNVENIQPVFLSWIQTAKGKCTSARANKVTNVVRQIRRNEQREHLHI